ncbi:MAG: hypothetical protein R3F59_05065 [Myxococcota bacterium]
MLRLQRARPPGGHAAAARARPGARPPERRHRALGAVRRIEAGHERILLGVEFVDLPESTFDALSDYTLRNL